MNLAIPRTTRLLGSIAIFLSIGSAVPGIGRLVVNCLSLVPQSTIGKFFLWNVTTAGFFEPNLLAALVSIPLFALLGRWIEPVWGGKELAVAAVVVNTAAGTATFVAMFILYVATRSQRHMYGLIPLFAAPRCKPTPANLLTVFLSIVSRFLSFAPVGGLSALIAALIVAAKQVFPDQQIGFSGATVASKHLPLIAFAVLSIASAARLVSVGEFVFMSSGFAFGWLYLRFFQKREQGRGDPSESFAFQTFFPEPVASVVGVVSAVVFAIFKPILAGVQDGSGKAVSGNAPSLQQSSADPVDAERRRQRALRALDERMSESKPSMGAQDGTEAV